MAWMQTLLLCSNVFMSEFVTELRAPGGGSQPVDSEHGIRSGRPELGSEAGQIPAVPVALSSD